MKNPLNKLFVPLVSFIFLSSVGVILHSCTQEKQSETKESDQNEAIQTAWDDSGEWVQKLTLSPDKVVRNAIWGQDLGSVNDSLELAESQPAKGKSYTLYFDESDLNFSDISYIPNEQNKLHEIVFDIFVESSEDVQPLIDQWKKYLDAKFGPSEANGKSVLWTKNKNTRINLENVSTSKDPGIKISFKAAN